MTHGALTEHSRSGACTTPDRKGREGKGREVEGNGSCSGQLQNQPHLSNARDAEIGIGVETR